ncbi:MAG: capsule assembly Wzi family protein [Cyclobacteriaceae bacterium]
MNPSKHIRPFLFFLLLYSFLFSDLPAQVLPTGQPLLEEWLRRRQLTGEFDPAYSFQLRPLTLPGQEKGFFPGDWETFAAIRKPRRGKRHRPEEMEWQWLPFQYQIRWANKRPYGYGDGAAVPAVGWQSHRSAGIEARYKFLYLVFQPELVFAQNKAFHGFRPDSRDAVNSARYYYWNYGNIPERFEGGNYWRLLPGRSKITAQSGSLEFGFSTQSLWWGPGQFNGLIFSNNAAGFPHFTFNSLRPLHTFMGSFEFQMISGWLSPYRGSFSQVPTLNDGYQSALPNRPKYLNGMTFSYQPKWVPGLHLGVNRVFQVFNHTMGASFADIFPVFTGITKASTDLLEQEQSGQFTGGRDQQISVFARYMVPAVQAEIYAEYGRRDHALNWREFAMNPEHARAFLMGFQKLVPLDKQGTSVQVRAEMAQQQESINRIIRYGSGYGASWAMHGRARGFTQKGQALGMGIGTGNNHQLIEVSLVDQFNKWGILLERMVNNQDFYYRAGFPQRNIAPWVDMSLGFLWDQRWDRLLMQSKLQMIQAHNYQWESRFDAPQDFPSAVRRFSLLVQFNFIYLWEGKD